MEAAIRVSGNIISELSEKIPSNVIALNELTKNSYDAGASYVRLVLNSTEKTLSIIDDGCGMDVNDINALFHISVSEKKYGEKNKYGRYTQGSKGLGFLSVFKFGTNVSWKTNKSEGIWFSVDYNSLLASEDISNYPVVLNSDASIKKGTEITISLTDYALKSLKEYLHFPVNYSKIVNAFDDKNFTVELIVDDAKRTSNDLAEIDTFLPDRQLYRVKYTSGDGIIKYYVNGNIAIEEPFAETDPRFETDIDLVIFRFRPYDKEKIDPFFYNFRGELTPLVFVNSNLFSNYTIFDPNIMRNVKSSSVLSQMIGYVRITSSDSLLNFNSDRTQFLQNELTDKIISFLVDINKQIQEVGSSKKAYLPDLDYLFHSKLPHDADDDTIMKNIKPDFAFADKVQVERVKSIVVYSVFGKETAIPVEEKVTKKVRQVPARIILSESEDNIAIPSRQIDLFTYVTSVQCSDGQRASADGAGVSIYIDGVKADSSILPSVSEEKETDIKYEYNDAKTGIVIAALKLVFYEPKAEVTAETTKGKLLTIPATASYTIGFNPSIQRLILQLNELDLIEFLEVIACSLRTMFEIAASSIELSGMYPSLLQGKVELEAKVKRIIEYVAADNKRITSIAIASGIEFKSIKNRLLPDEFFSCVKKAHLGAHKATIHLTEPEIKEIASKASLFVVVVNEMLKATI